MKNAKKAALLGSIGLGRELENGPAEVWQIFSCNSLASFAEAAAAAAAAEAAALDAEGPESGPQEEVCGLEVWNYY